MVMFTTTIMMPVCCSATRSVLIRASCRTCKLISQPVNLISGLAVGYWLEHVESILHNCLLFHTPCGSFVLIGPLCQSQERVVKDVDAYLCGLADVLDPKIYPRAKFISEFGFQSWPSWQQYKPVTGPGDWIPKSPMSEFRYSSNHTSLT